MTMAIHPTDQKDWPWMCEVTADGFDTKYFYVKDPTGAVLKAVSWLQEEGHTVAITEIVQV